MAENSIIYCLVAFGEKSLAQYSEYKGTFQRNCQNYLHSVESNTSAGYKVEDSFIYYINENGITYLILTGSKYSKGSALTCLESIKKEFLSSFADTNFEEIEEFGLDKEFRPKLKMKFEYFNENKEVVSELIQKFSDEIRRIKEDVLNASEILNERGDKVEKVNNKAEDLAETSHKYKRVAEKVKKETNKKKIYFTIGIVSSLLVLAYVIVCIVCHSWTFNCSG